MLNNITIMGRITHDLELKATASGINVISFSIATERNFKQDGEYKADFFNVTAWRGTAEFICNYFKKGDPILITGSLQTREYTDKDDNKRKVTEIVADKAYFCGGTKKDGEKSKPAPAISNGIAPDFTADPGDDDYPF